MRDRMRERKTALRATGPKARRTSLRRRESRGLKRGAARRSTRAAACELRANPGGAREARAEACAEPYELCARSWMRDSSQESGQDRRRPLSRVSVPEG